MTVPFYVLEATVEACDAEFYLNDLPVVRRGPDLGKHYAGQSNPFLVDGVNEISVLVNPGPEPAAALAPPGGRRRAPAPGALARASLARYPFGATVGGPSREELASVSWSAPGDGRPVVFPCVATARVDLGELFGPWRWQEAPRLELDEDTTEDLWEVLEDLRLSLTLGDPEPFLSLGRPRLEEIARAYGKTPEKKEKIIRKATADDAAQDWWGLQDAGRSDASFRLCGRHRLVELLATDWEPLLRENPDHQGGVGLYGMMLCRLEEGWRIVR